MKPYYEHAGITIYHGDCREVMEEWEGLRTKSFDLLLTDPPYGISYDSSHTKYKNGIAREECDWDLAPPDAGTMTTARRLCNGAIVWGGNCFASILPNSTAWICWVKTARNDADIRQSDMELAWTDCLGRGRVFRHLWIGAYRESESGMVNWHPTQKPEALMRWCLSLVPCKTVLDPFMGSGTTLVSAKQLGIKATGIELQEKYCEIAAKRLSQDVLPLIDPNPEQATPLDLFGL